jgi:hypothetical protein
LPRHKLDEDFASRVLRIAEESKPRKEGERSRARDLTAAGEVSAAERASRRWRAIVYPLLALAAAVAVMLNSEKEKDKADKHPQIARAPVFQDSPAEMSAPSDELDERDDRSLSKAKATTPLSSASGDEEIDMDEAAAENEGLVEDNRAAPSGAAGPPTATGRMSGGMGGSGLSKSRGAEGRRRSELGLAPGTLVVTCRLAPGAVQDKAFESLLARNHLVPVSAPKLSAGKPLNPRLPAGDLDDSSRKADLADSAQRPNKKAEKAQDVAADADAKDSQSGPKEAWSKSVVVELDSRQLEAVMADLRNHPEQFLAVELPRRRAVDREEALPADALSPSALPAADEQRSSKQDKPMSSKQEQSFEFRLAPAAAGSSSAQGDGPNATDKTRADAFDAKGSADAGPPARLRVLFRLSTAPGN